MSDNFTVTANIRNDIGKGASRRLRHSDMVPAIIYGGNKPPMTIVLDHVKLNKALENEAFYTHILTIKMGDQEEKVILRDLQRHPYRPRIVHADFQRISATEKLTMRIPLHFKGSDIAPGVKLKGGMVAHLMSEIELRCLPADLPEYIEVDLSALDLDQTIHLSNLKLPENTEIPGLIPDGANDKPVASIYIPRAVVEETTEAPAAAAPVETIAEAKAKAKEEEEAKAGTSEPKKGQEPKKAESKKKE